MFELEKELVLEWFLESFPAPPCVDGVISTLGSGPYEEDSFDEILKVANVSISRLDETVEVLIVGRDASEEYDIEIDGLLDARENKRLKVYSQEMFLAYWVSGRDPFDDLELLHAFSEGHETLEFLTSRWISWPTTYVSFGNRGGLDIDSPKIGVLRLMGYSAGAKNLPAATRREVLTRVYGSVLPHVHSTAHMQEWGKPRSKERLKKMADSMASFCRREKVKGNEVAAGRYTEDLDWLRKTYYTGRFKFQWPSTFVG